MIDSDLFLEYDIMFRKRYDKDQIKLDGFDDWYSERYQRAKFILEANIEARNNVDIYYSGLITIGTTPEEAYSLIEIRDKLKEEYKRLANREQAEIYHIEGMRKLHKKPPDLVGFHNLNFGYYRDLTTGLIVKKGLYNDGVCKNPATVRQLQLIFMEMNFVKEMMVLIVDYLSNNQLSRIPEHIKLRFNRLGKRIFNNRTITQEKEDE